MSRRVKFQVALWDHIFDDLIRLGEKSHRTYRQQASHYLEEAVKQARLQEEEDLEGFLEADHAPAP